VGRGVPHQALRAGLEVRCYTSIVALERNKAVRGCFSAAHKNVVCGRHSGFPLCCVMFFSLLWFPMRSAGKKHRSLVHLTQPYLRVVNRIRERRSRGGWGRLPCPICLLRDNPTTPTPCACWKRAGDAA